MFVGEQHLHHATFDPELKAVAQVEIVDLRYYLLLDRLNVVQYKTD